MTGYGRKVVVQSDFETGVGAVGQALREEGFQVVARVDLRDHFWRHANTAFGPYVLIHAWSPDMALAALRLNADVGSCLATTFAVYKETDTTTVVLMRDPFSPMADESAWRMGTPDLASAADGERERAARVLDRLRSPAKAGGCLDACA